jgi:hypothetical protein
MLEIAEVQIPIHLRGTGKCKHVRCSENVTGNITNISLVEYEPGGGFYLLYKGPLGEELNDLFFETMQEAVGQLEFEFGEEVSSRLAAQIAEKGI